MTKADLIKGILVAAIWGVNFSIIKLGLNTIDPFVLAGLRFSLAAIPLIFFIPKPDIPISTIALYGLLFGVGLWGVVNLGIFLGLSAGVASLLLQFSAFITLLLGYLFFKELLHFRQYVGMFISMLDLLFVVQITDGSVPLVGVICVFIAATSWAFSNVIIKKYQPKNMLSFVVWGSVFAPLPLFLMAYINNGSTVFLDLVNMGSTGVFSIVFQAYITTLFGYYIWNGLMAKYPVSQVAPLSLLIPIFGLLGSYIVFNEVTSFEKLLGFTLVLIGLLIFMFSKGIKTNES
jgi:O-acetylserine/cysteine efflux transporter